MHQPLEDYIPPPHVSYLGIIAGFVVMWMAGTAMSDSAFIGFLVGCIVGAPAGLIGAWVLHYMSLAPIRADDKRRYQENQVRYKREVQAGGSGADGLLPQEERGAASVH